MITKIQPHSTPWTQPYSLLAICLLDINICMNVAKILKPINKLPQGRILLRLMYFFLNKLLGVNNDNVVVS